MTVGAPRTGTVGILPIGALGAAFFFHLTRGTPAPAGQICFIERAGSKTVRAHREKGCITIAYGGETHRIPADPVCRDDLMTCARAPWLPEIILVCTQSDQVLPVIGQFVELLEFLFKAEGIDAAVDRLPLLVLCSNGIYFQRVRRFFVEALEESTLFGRLPDLWSEPMGRIVGKLLRGVTMQTGQRQGEAGDTIYRPGPPGHTWLAGGAPTERQRCRDVLHGLGGRFEVDERHSPTRVEFDKALVNLFANLLGQFTAIDEHGDFRLATVRDILADPQNAETRELGHHVVAVGRAVRAYAPDEAEEAIYEAAMTIVRSALHHVPSSIQWIESQLRSGKLTPQITPTEKWLLEPLIQYASTAGLEDSTRYFQDLIHRIETRLASAIDRHASAS